jgi:cytoskeletal protein CcmA (bactofilin family)
MEANKAKERNVKITGSGSVSGGDYKSIRITGEAEMGGDVNCQSLHCTGNVLVKGSLSADILRLTGEADIKGDFLLKNARTLGNCRVQGKVRAVELLMRGMFAVEGDLDADRLTVKGAAEIGGFLNAGQLEIQLFGPCRIADIGCGTIRVKRSTLQSLKELFKPDGPSELTVGTIEGDRLELSHTNAQIVRGNRIIIGPGCSIEEVEYLESLVVHKSSRVGRQTKR